MSSLKILVLMHHLMLICFIICITCAAFHFESIWVLFFYIVPALLSGVTVKQAEAEEKKEEEQHNG